MKKIAALLLLCFCAFCFCACVASDLEDKGTDFAEAVFARDYDRAAEQMTENMVINMSEDVMTELADAAEDQFGAFDSVSSVTIGSDPDYPDHTIAKVKVKLADSYIIMELAYNESQQVDGINILATEEMAGASGTEEANSGASVNSTPTASDRGTAAKAFLTAVFSGDMETATAYLGEDTQSDSAVTSIAAMVTEAESNYGAYEEIGAVNDSGDTVLVNVLFTDGSSMFEISFDDNNKIVGFSIYAQ